MMSELIEKRLNSRFSILGEIFAQHYVQEMRRIQNQTKETQFLMLCYPNVGDCDDNNDNDNDDNDNVDDQQKAVVSCTH